MTQGLRESAVTRRLQAALGAKPSTEAWEAIASALTELDDEVILNEALPECTEVFSHRAWDNIERKAPPAWLERVLRGNRCAALRAASTVAIEGVLPEKFGPLMGCTDLAGIVEVELELPWYRDSIGHVVALLDPARGPFASLETLWLSSADGALGMEPALLEVLLAPRARPLRGLYLSYLHLSPAQLERLCRADSLAGLRVLDLFRTGQVGAAALGALCEAPFTPHLERLALCATGFGDDAAARLIQTEWPCLGDLILADEPVGPAARDALSAWCDTRAAFFTYHEFTPGVFVPEPEHLDVIQRELYAAVEQPPSHNTFVVIGKRLAKLHAGFVEETWMPTLEARVRDWPDESRLRLFAHSGHDLTAPWTRLASSATVMLQGARELSIAARWARLDSLRELSLQLDDPTDLQQHNLLLRCPRLRTLELSMREGAPEENLLEVLCTIDWPPEIEELRLEELRLPARAWSLNTLSLADALRGDRRDVVITIGIPRWLDHDDSLVEWAERYRGDPPRHTRIVFR